MVGKLALPFIRTLILLLVFLELLAGVGLATAAPLKVGDRFPHLTLPDRDGQKVEINQEAPGRILLVHFWWTRCIFCRNDLAALNQIHAHGADRQVLAINVGDNRRAIDGFLDGINPVYPILIDEGGVMAHQHGIIGIPITFILDRQGIIRHKIVGEINAAGLFKLLAEIE